MKTYKLSATEEALMHLFWRKNRLLSVVDISQRAKDASWTGNSIHKMFHALQKKGIIEISGAALNGARFVRQFMPTLTKEEYTAELIAGQGIGVSSLAQVAVALAKREREEMANSLLRSAMSS